MPTVLLPAALASPVCSTCAAARCFCSPDCCQQPTDVSLTGSLLFCHLLPQEVDGDAWVVYPWDAEDIDEHNELGQQ